MEIKALIRNINYEQKNKNCESCNTMLSNEEIRKLVVATIDEIEKGKKEKIEEQKTHQTTIVKAIIEAEKQKKEMENEEIKNRKLHVSHWVGIIISCAIMLCALLFVVYFSFDKNFVMAGKFAMIFFIGSVFAYTIYMMAKFTDFDRIINIITILIAVVTLVISMWD